MPSHGLRPDCQKSRALIRPRISGPDPNGSLEEDNPWSPSRLRMPRVICPHHRTHGEDGTHHWSEARPRFTAPENAPPRPLAISAHVRQHAHGSQHEPARALEATDADPSRPSAMLCRTARHCATVLAARRYGLARMSRQCRAEPYIAIVPVSQEKHGAQKPLAFSARCSTLYSRPRARVQRYTTSCQWIRLGVLVSVPTARLTTVAPSRGALAGNRPAFYAL